MTQPAQQAPAAAPTAAPTQPQRTTLEERAHTVLAELRETDAAARKTRAEASATAADPSSSPSAPGSSAASDDAAKTPEQLRAERKARLDAAMQKDRARVDQKQRQAAEDKLSRQLETEKQARAAAEERAKNLIDLEQLDEASFLALAEKKGIPPQRVVEWMKTAMTQPEKVAEAAALKAARAELDPKVKALEEQIADLKRGDEERKLADQRAYAQQQEQSAAREFFEFTNANATQAPLAAAYLKHHGAQQFYAVAAEHAKHLEDGSGYQAVLDAIEEQLSTLAPIFAPAKTPSPAQAPSPAPAAARATTISNSLAGQRSSVVTGEDLSKLTLDERAARTIEALERGEF